MVLKFHFQIDTAVREDMGKVKAKAEVVSTVERKVNLTFPIKTLIQKFSVLIAASSSKSP